MATKVKSCGGCIYFGKWKNDKYGGGLCDALDARTTSDGGRNCRFWKAIPYKPNTELGKKLITLRKQAIKGGVKLLNADEILDEIKKRR